MSVVRLKEYERDGPVRLSNEQIRSIRQFSGKVVLEASDDSGCYFVRADSWVGKFTVPGLTFDIVPKIGPVNALKMYLMGDGEASPELMESLNRASDDDYFWDLTAEILMRTTDAIIRSGIRREYVEFEQNSDFVRGQVVIAEDLLQNVPIRFGTVCRYSELTPDIEVNRAVLWGLEVLTQGVSTSMAQRIRFFTKRLEEISLPRDVPEVDYRRESGSYRTALFLVDLVSRSLQTDSSTFGLSGFGLLMDMNQVFEGFVRNMLRTKLLEKGLVVPDKRSTRRPLCKEVMLEPDFLIYASEAIVAVCDCKYKDDWRFQNADVYQMLAYLEGFDGVRTAFVFHPESDADKISIDKIEYPRSGTLFRIGLPSERLLDMDVWAEVCDVFFASLNGSGSETIADTGRQISMTG
jgi:5-methylcytosine-specific restriction enzyme subunit McrC